MVLRAFLAALAYFICYGGNWLFAQSMTERPIVVGFITGLFLGDIKIGIIVGAAVEAIFMGSVNIGGNISAEPAAAATFAVVMATMENISADAALALSVPVGVFSAFLFMIINNVLYNFTAPIIDRLAEKGNDKGLITMNFTMWFIRFFIVALCMFAGLLAGGAAIEATINSIPAVVLTGLNTAGKFLPAVGLSILMKMLWNKQLAIYFFLGFIMVVYLGLPQVAIAALAIILVISVALRDMELHKLQETRTAITPVDREEDFFA